MKIFLSIAIFLASPILIADENSKSISEYTYKECLRDSIQKNQNLSADDIRSLCKEITSKPERVYDWDDGKVTPANKYTKCYEKALEEETNNGTGNPHKIANLRCK